MGTEAQDDGSITGDAFLDASILGAGSEEDASAQGTPEAAYTGYTPSPQFTPSSQTPQQEQPQQVVPQIEEPKDYISIEEAAGQLLAAKKQGIPPAEYYNLIEDLYSKSNTSDPKVAEFYAEIGQQVKDMNRIEYDPDFSKLVPPLEYSGFDSLDDKKASIDAWKEKAKSQLHLAMGSDYGLNKLGVDAKIDAMAKQRKRELSAIAKYGEDKKGDVADTGGVSDVLSRLGQGFVADTLKSVGAKDTAEAAEDFFVENPRFDADFTSELAAFIGMGGGNLALGMAAAAMTGGLGVALGAGAKAGAAVEGTAALAETGFILSRTSPLAGVLKMPAITPASVGAAVSAGSGAALVEQDVYEQVYEQTGSRVAATRASLMSLSGVALGTLTHYFIASGIMNPLSKSVMNNKSAIVTEVSKAIEQQTDLQGTRALRETLKTAYAVADSRTKRALIKGTESGVVGAAGFSVMNASIEDAISSNILTMEDTGFDLSNQGKSAALGLLAGMITGGAGGVLESPNAANLQKLRKVISRIDEKEAKIHQALFNEMAAKPQGEQRVDTTSLGGKPKPAEEAVTAEPVLTPEQQVMSVKEEATAKIDELTQQEIALTGQRSELEVQRNLLNATINPDTRGEKINLDKQIKDLDIGIGALVNERTTHERTLEVAKLQEQLVQEQAGLKAVGEKATPGTVGELPKETGPIQERIKGITDRLTELGALEKPAEIKPEERVKASEQPKTNDELITNRIIKQGVNPEIPVDKLPARQRTKELGILDSEIAKLPEGLEKRQTELLAEEKKHVDSEKAAALDKSLHRDADNNFIDPLSKNDKDNYVLSDKKLNREQEALESYEGQLTPDQENRLKDVIAAKELREESRKLDESQALDEVIKLSVDKKAVEDFTTKEAEHALEALEKHKAKGEKFTNAQELRLREIETRTPKLFESLTDEAFNALPKLTKQLTHDSPTLGELIKKKRSVHKQENKDAVQEAINAFKNEKNIQKEAATEFKKGVSSETVKAEGKKQFEKRGARAAHEAKEAVQAKHQSNLAAAREADAKLKKTSKDNTGTRPRREGFFKEEESVESSKPQTRDFFTDPERVSESSKPQTRDTAQTKGGFEDPTKPAKTYEQMEKAQDEVVSKDDTVYKEPMAAPGFAAPKLDLTAKGKAELKALRETYPRIDPEKRDPINKPLKSNDFLRKVNDFLKTGNIRYQGLSKNGPILGAYFGRIGNTVTSMANKLDTAVHEIGHALDHMHGIATDWIKTDGPHKFDAELQKFWAHATVDKNYADIVGKRAEGLAEYIRAYMFNEKAAREAAPEFTKFFEEKLPAEKLEQLKELSQDLVDISNSSALDLMNNQHQTAVEALNTKSSWTSRILGDTNATGSSIPFMTKLFSKVNRDAAALNWVLDRVTKEVGVNRDDILERNDPRVFIQGVRKVAGKIQDMYEHGVRDPDPDSHVQSTGGGKRLTEGYDKIFDPLAGSGDFWSDVHETSTLMHSKSVIELLEPIESRFKELTEKLPTLPEAEQVAARQELRELGETLSETTGASLGIQGRNDLDIARGALATLKENPERYKQLDKTAENISGWFDAYLTVAEKTGLISPESATNIRASRSQYAPMYRLLEQGVDSFIDSSIDPLSRRHGSTKVIKNLHASLLEAGYKLTERAYRNQANRVYLDFLSPRTVEKSVIRKQILQELRLGEDEILPTTQLEEMVQAEWNKIHADDNVFGGERTNISDIAYKLEVNGVAIEPKGEAERALTTSIIRDGKKEYWKFNDEFLYDAFKGLTDLHNTNIPILTPINNFFKLMITHASPFAIRNPIKDTFGRLFSSEAGASKGLKATFSRATEQDVSLLRQGMGDQSGYHLRSYADFARFQRQILQDKGLVKGNIFIPVQKGFKKWSDVIASTERFNRLREYKASFESAKERGATDYDAHLYAGNQASSIMDFTSAGQWMRALENFFPFASAGSVGVRKGISTLKAHPGRSLAYFVAMGVIPSLIERTMAKVGGYEKDWDERSPIYKDMFMSFKVDDNFWVHVPRHYELAVMSNMANRLLDSWEGKPGAFEGAAANMARSFIPIDPLNIGSPLGAPFEALANYDTFRQHSIVPINEENRRLSERKEPKNASAISLAIHNALIDWGVDDSFIAKKFGDARIQDHLFLAITGTLGSEALTIGDLAKADKRARYLKKLGGIFGETPATNSRDALFVNEFIASENISPQSKSLQKYANLRDAYYDAETEAEKEKAAQAFLDESLRLRLLMEEKGPDYFRSAKTIENRRKKKLAAAQEK